jgi:hypothetical protein
MRTSLTYQAMPVYSASPESTITPTTMLVRPAPYATKLDIAILQIYYYPKEHIVVKQVDYYVVYTTPAWQKDLVNSHYYCLTNSILHMRYP